MRCRGGLKNARMSSRRRFMVCSSEWSSSRLAGAPDWRLVISRVVIFLPWAGSGLVGVDDVLVDMPGDLERDMVFVGEHSGEAVLLLVGEEPGPGLDDASDAVERVTTAPVFEGFLLNALAAAV